MNEGRFWPWRPPSQAVSGDVSLRPAPALTYPVNIQHDKWRGSAASPLTNPGERGPMPEWLVDRRRLNHCHKRHIVYRTERHCNTNTNTPRVGDTLGKSSVCGSGDGLEANAAMKRLLQPLTEKLSVLHFAIAWPLFFLPASLPSFWITSKGSSSQAKNGVCSFSAGLIVVFTLQSN